MALGVDAHGKGASPTSFGATQSESVTLGASVTALYVYAIWEGNYTMSSLVWDDGGTNQSMTSMNSRVTTPDGVGTYSQAFKLMSPTTGTKTLKATWSGSVTTGQLYWIAFTGADTTTGHRTLQSRTSTDGTGPGLTDANWTSGDYEVHGALLFATSITFDAGETTAEDDNLFGSTLSSGLSYKSSSGTVGCTDTGTYAEIAFAVIPASGGGGGSTPRVQKLPLLGVA